jgi:transcriptional regulatory protein RtcR
MTRNSFSEVCCGSGILNATRPACDSRRSNGCEEEIGRLNASWATLEGEASREILSQLLNRDELAAIDLFDRAQLAHVIQICQESRTLSDAGRRLFGASRAKKTSTNDADRLRKYLGRFGIDWAQIANA